MNNINNNNNILRLQRRGLSTLQGTIPDQSDVEILFLEGNALSTFEGLGTQPMLRELHAQNNQITSFSGMTKQRSLQCLNLAGNPIALRPHYRTMALLTIGTSLCVIDGEEVRQSEKESAIRLGRHAAIAVSYGWILDGQEHTVEEYTAITDKLRRARRAAAAGQVPVPRAVVSPSEVPQPGGPRMAAAATTTTPPEDGGIVPLLASRGRVASSSASSVSRPGAPTMSRPHSTSAMMMATTNERPQRTSSPPNPGLNPIPSVQRPDLGEGVSSAATTTETAHVIAQLHTQISTLRMQLDDQRLKAQREAQAAEKLRQERAQACDMGSSGLGMEEVRMLLKAEFGGGMKLTTNVIFASKIGDASHSEGNTSRIPSAHITVDPNYVHFAHYFTRVRMGEVPLEETKEVLLDHHTVYIRLHDGTVFEVTCEQLPKAVALFKALFFFRGMLPPSVPQIQTNQPMPSPTSTTTIVAAPVSQHNTKPDYQPPPQSTAGPSFMSDVAEPRPEPTRGDSVPLTRKSSNTQPAHITPAASSVAPSVTTTSATVVSASTSNLQQQQQQQQHSNYLSQHSNNNNISGEQSGAATPRSHSAFSATSGRVAAPAPPPPAPVVEPAPTTSPPTSRTASGPDLKNQAPTSTTTTPTTSVPAPAAAVAAARSPSSSSSSGSDYVFQDSDDESPERGGAAAPLVIGGKTFGVL
eukprot:PhM_4_TR9552/c3_g1_i1/m.15456